MLCCGHSFGATSNNASKSLSLHLLTERRIVHGPQKKYNLPTIKKPRIQEIHHLKEHYQGTCFIQELNSAPISLHDSVTTAGWFILF